MNARNRPITYWDAPLSGLSMKVLFFMGLMWVCTYLMVLFLLPLANELFSVSISSDPSSEAHIATWIFAFLIFSGWVGMSLEFKDMVAKAQDAAPQLAARRAALLRKNEYGLIDPEPWVAEKIRFLEMCKIQPGYIIFPAAMQAVERIASDEIVNREPNSGTEYEARCRQILDAAGWHTFLTPVTGDKGADIVASRDGLKVAIQCKNYRSPVGTRAVQEIMAGAEYHKADHAVVVSEAEYTRQAIDLASSLGVLLLKSSDLGDLFERLA